MESADLRIQEAVALLRSAEAELNAMIEETANHQAQQGFRHDRHQLEAVIAQLEQQLRDSVPIEQE